jgi:hypothetical protein
MTRIAFLLVAVVTAEGRWPSEINSERRRPRSSRFLVVPVRRTRIGTRSE